MKCVIADTGPLVAILDLKLRRARRTRYCQNAVHVIPFSAVTTISLKVPDTLDSRLTEEAQRRRTSKSAVVRECVEKMLLAPRKDRGPSCLDLAGDLAGCLKGPHDIATNPKRRHDFGQ